MNPPIRGWNKRDTPKYNDPPIYISDNSCATAAIHQLSDNYLRLYVSAYFLGNVERMGY